MRTRQALARILLGDLVGLAAHRLDRPQRVGRVEGPDDRASTAAGLESLTSRAAVRVTIELLVAGPGDS
ncbi:MAG: hypothetical protein ACRDJ2_07165 [Actinomycetota bacterium]